MEKKPCRHSNSLIGIQLLVLFQAFKEKYQRMNYKTRCMSPETESCPVSSDTLQFSSHLVILHWLESFEQERVADPSEINYCSSLELGTRGSHKIRNLINYNCVGIFFNFECSN